MNQCRVFAVVAVVALLSADPGGFEARPALVRPQDSVSIPSAAAQAARTTAPDADARRAIVEEIASLLNKRYVFPDTAKAIEYRLRDQLAKSAYDHVSTPREFAARVNADLAEVGHDRHMRFTHDPARAAGLARLESRSPEEVKAELDRRLADGRRDNFGFRRVEWLPGNVGYLDFREFVSAQDGGATAVAALNFLAHCDAVIIDLRRNGGGEPTQIQLMSSYFFAGPTHLNDLYYRTTDTTEHYWTLPFVPGPRMTGADLYILTSSATFSGAEEFSYNMKSLKRATLVGETTGGGAHPTDEHILKGEYVLRVPMGRAINPVTKTNWEGTGVEPDVKVPAGQAFDRAYAMAIDRLAETATDAARKREYAWVAEAAHARLRPVALSETVLRSFVGEYGERNVVFEDGGLVWQRGLARARLAPLTTTLFAFEGREDIRIEFEKKDRVVVAMVVVGMDGSRTVLARSGGVRS